MSETGWRPRVEFPEDWSQADIEAYVWELQFSNWCLRRKLEAAGQEKTKAFSYRLMSQRRREQLEAVGLGPRVPRGKGRPPGPTTFEDVAKVLGLREAGKSPREITRAILPLTEHRVRRILRLFEDATPPKP